MKMNMNIVLVTAVLAALQTAFAGDISGKITLKGTPKPEAEIQLDPSCSKLHTEKLKTRFYVADSSGGLADVFVYIKDGLTGKTFPVPSEAAVLDQVGCEYTPYISGVQVKQKLSVKNSDPVIHNVHVQPTAPGNKESNKAQMAGAKPLDYSFDSAEVFVKFKCDVHPWMFSYVGVLDHPYYAVSGKDGSFTIKNVPAGKYTVEAVHRKTHPNGKGVSQEVTVADSGAKADFVVEVK